MQNTVYGKDSAGNRAYISVSKENGKIKVYSSEERADVIMTKKQARELIQVLEEHIKE